MVQATEMQFLILILCLFRNVVTQNLALLLNHC